MMYFELVATIFTSEEGSSQCTVPCTQVLLYLKSCLMIDSR